MTKARDIASAAPAPSTVSATEIGYLDGVTSAIQTQLNAKQAVVSGVDSTEIGYLDGVTSAIQTQLNSKIGQATAINPTLIDAKGDLIVGSAADTVARLAVGTNNHVLTADSAATNGVKWAALPASASGLTLVSTNTFSGVSTADITGVFTSTYQSYLCLFTEFFVFQSAAGRTVQIRMFEGVDTIYTDGCQGGVIKIKHDGTSTTGFGNYSGATASIGIMGGEGERPAGGSILITTANSGGLNAIVQWKSGNNPNDQANMGTFFGGFHNTNNSSITGLRVQANTGSFSGKVRIYGLANS